MKSFAQTLYSLSHSVILAESLPAVPNSGVPEFILFVDSCENRSQVKHIQWPWPVE